MMSAATSKKVTDEASKKDEASNVVGFPTDINDHISALQTDAAGKTGKGLSKIAEPGSTEIYRINPYVIQIKPGFNCRDFTTPDNIAHVEGLSHQIAEDGVLEPLKVFYEEVDGVRIAYLEDGECRLRATKIAIEKLHAPIKNIPVRIANRANEAERMFAQYRANNGGKPFTPLESAVNFKRAISFGFTVDIIAKKTGMTTARVKAIMDFDENTSHEIKELIRTESISTGLATQVIAAVKNQGQAVKVLKTAVKKAASEGREHATAKDVTGDVGAKINKVKGLTAIIERSKVKRVGDNVQLTMPAEDFTLLNNILGLVAPAATTAA